MGRRLNQLSYQRPLRFNDDHLTLSFVNDRHLENAWFFWEVGAQKHILTAQSINQADRSSSH